MKTKSRAEKLAILGERPPKFWIAGIVINHQDLIIRPFQLRKAAKGLEDNFRGFVVSRNMNRDKRLLPHSLGSGRCSGCESGHEELHAYDREMHDKIKHGDRQMNQRNQNSGEHHGCAEKKNGYRTHLFFSRAQNVLLSEPKEKTTMRI